MTLHIPRISASSIGGYVEHLEYCDEQYARLEKLNPNTATAAKEHVLANISTLYQRFRYNESLFHFSESVLKKSDFGHREEFIATHHMKEILSGKGFAVVELSSLDDLVECIFNEANGREKPTVFVIKPQGDNVGVIGEYGPLGLPGNAKSYALFLPDLLVYEPVTIDQRKIHQISIIDYKMTEPLNAMDTKVDYRFQQSIYTRVLENALDEAIQYVTLPSFDREDLRVNNYLMYIRKSTSKELLDTLHGYQPGQKVSLMEHMEDLLVDLSQVYAREENAVGKDYTHAGIMSRVHRLLTLTYGAMDERIVSVNESVIFCTFMQATVDTLNNDGAEVEVNEHGINSAMFGGDSSSPYFNCQKCLRSCCPVNSFKTSSNGKGGFVEFLAYLNQPKSQLPLSSDLSDCIKDMVNGVTPNDKPAANTQVAMEERIAITIPNAPTASFTYRRQVNHESESKRVDQVVFKHEDGLVPLQRIFYNEVISEGRHKSLKRSYLISSPTNSGKMDCALMLANQAMIDCHALGRRGRVLILQPKKQLANFTVDQVLEYFHPNTKTCPMKGAFYKNHPLYGVDVRGNKPISARVFHGSSTGSIKDALSSYDIVVSTYEYMIEFLLSQEIEPFDCIIFDEVHSRLRLDSEEMGSSMLTSMLNYTFIMQIIKTQRNPYVAMMSGTLPVQWTDNMSNNPHINVISSAFSHSAIKTLGMDIDAAGIQGNISRLVTFRDGYFELKPGALNQPIEGVERYKTRVLPVFVYSKREIDLIGTHFEAMAEELAKGNNDLKPFKVLKYSGSKATSSKERVEKMIDDSNRDPDSCAPIVLISTNAIAEGAKLPSNLAIIVYSQDPLGNQFYDPDTIRQMSNRISRGFNPNAKIPGVVITVKVDTSRVREREDNYTKLCLTSCMLDNRSEDGLTVTQGMDLVARTTGYYNQINPIKITESIRNLKDRHYVEDSGLITPSGRMVIKYDSWMPLSDFHARSIEANILINTVILPYLSNDEFMSDFVGQKLIAGLNYFDPTYSEMFKVLVKESTPKDATCEKIFNHVFAEDYGHSSTHNILEWLDNLQRPEIVEDLMRILFRFGQPTTTNAAHVVSLVKMALWKTLFIKVKRDKDGTRRSFLQEPFYDANTRFDNRSRLLYNYDHFLDLTAKSRNLSAYRAIANEECSNSHLSLITPQALEMAKITARKFIDTIHPLYLDSRKFQENRDKMRNYAKGVMSIIE